MPVTVNMPMPASTRRRDFIRPKAASFQAVDDEDALVARHALVGLPEVGGEFVTEHAAETGHDGDVLLAARRVADDAALVAETVAVVPQLGAGCRVVGVNHPARIRDKHEIACGRKEAAQRRFRKTHLPLLFARYRIARIQMAIDLTVGGRRYLEGRTEVQLSLWFGDRGCLDDLEGHAPFLTDLVVHARSGIVGAGIPADAAPDKRTKRFCDLAGLEIAAADQFAGLGIDRLDEVDVLDERPNVLNLRVGAVVDKDKAALVRVYDIMLAATVDHDELAYGTVEIPSIMRQLLMVEFELAGIDIERDHGARIEVIARAGTACLVIGPRPVVERR